MAPLAVFLWVAGGVVATLPASAQEQAPLANPAIRTWGGTPATHEVGVPLPPSAVALPAPAAPSATLGVPIGSESPAPPSPSPPNVAGRPGLPPPPSLTLDEIHEPIVRTPGRVGLRYVLEGIEVRGNTTTLSRVVLRYVPFRVGDPLDVDDPELVLTRFRLLGTGFFRDAQLTLRKGTTRGNAILVVTVRERNTIVVNDLWLGLSTDANPDTGATRPLTAYGGVDVSETNLGGTGVTLGGAIAVAEDQLALRTRFVDPQFLKTEWTVKGELLYNSAKDFFGNGSVQVDDPKEAATQDYAVAAYTRLGGSIGAGHDLGISTRLYVDYRLEHLDTTLPLAASDRRGNETVPIDFSLIRGESFLSTLRASLIYDTVDEPFLPTRGTRVSLLGEVSLSPLGSDYPYSKIQAHVTRWFTLPWGQGHVLSLEAFAGGIFGTAPLFEQYYVGDFSDLLPDRVLGLNFDRRTAPNFFSTDIGQIRYGDYAAKLDVAYRFPIYRGTRSVYGIDLFGSAGIYGVASEEDFQSPPLGVTGFSTVPIDFTFNLGVQIETSAGGFTFGLSNFLGFIPNYGGGR